MDQETENYITDLENQVRQERSERANLQQQRGETMFSADHNDNLIRWQLDIKEELERIEHLLRGHIPSRDAEGNEYWKEAENKDDVVFNERGVQEILKIISWYLCKNIILSNYSEEDIQIRVHQFGNALTDFIFTNYDLFGWDNPDKIKHFEMVVMNIVNTVEAAYLRALNGGERESLRTARHVTQNEPIGSMMGQGFSSQKSSKFSFLKPSKWSR